MTGKVKFFIEEKGYGFITANDSEKDYFFHSSGLLGPVRKDDSVSFDVEEGKKGPKAVKIRKL